MTWETGVIQGNSGRSQSILRRVAAEDLRFHGDGHHDMRNAYVYMMSNKSHRLYVGWTTDLLQRAIQHKTKTYPNGFTARYTFDRLVWFEVHDSMEAALERERKIKHWTRARKVALIQEKNPNWIDLTPRLHWSSSLG